MAVEDLDEAYKKVKNWNDLDKAGKLKDYVEEVVRKQAKRVAKIYSEISFTQTDISAVEFFNVEGEVHQLYFGMLGLDGLPREIVEQVEYIKQNRDAVEAKIRGFRTHATRKLTDEAM